MHAKHSIPLACSDAFLDKKAFKTVSLGAHLVPFCDLNGTVQAAAPGEQAKGAEHSKLGSARLCGLPRQLSTMNYHILPEPSAEGGGCQHGPFHLIKFS